jgi:hypothetical protein
MSRLIGLLVLVHACSIHPMIIPLNQFEQIVDEVILKRGLDYFRKGLVEHGGVESGLRVRVHLFTRSLAITPPPALPRKGRVRVDPC